MFPFIAKAIQDIKQGKMVIVVDDETRENEGDLIMAAKFITPEKFAFMHDCGRGLICVPMEKERAKKLNLWPIVPDELNTEFTKCKFMVSVDYKNSPPKADPPLARKFNEYKTGVSFAARTRTIQKLANAKVNSDNFVRPGHITPLVADNWGVLARDGHTEAAVDLVRLSGIAPRVAALVEILKKDGAIARGPYLKTFARKYGLTLITIAELADYRKCNEQLVERAASAHLPTRFGKFIVHIYKEKITGKEHLALVIGNIDNNTPVLTRVHSRCLTGDVFHSLRCDCDSQLHFALEAIAKRGAGALVYLNQEGRDIGLTDKIKSYALQELGLDTVEANIRLGYKPDMRVYHIGTQILKDLGVHKMELMTNNPKKIAGLEQYGLEIVRRVPIIVSPNEHNRKYLFVKRDKLGHLLH